MRKIASTLSVLLLILNLFGQEINDPRLSKDQYLDKSQRQRKAANIVLAGGGLFILTAVVFPKGEEHPGSLFFGPSYENDGIRVILLATGVVAAFVSIPIYIASARNKRRGNRMSASLIMEGKKVICFQRMANIRYPALSLKMRL